MLKVLTGGRTALTRNSITRQINLHNISFVDLYILLQYRIYKCQSKIEKHPLRRIRYSRARYYHPRRRRRNDNLL